MKKYSFLKREIKKSSIILVEMKNILYQRGVKTDNNPKRKVADSISE